MKAGVWIGQKYADSYPGSIRLISKENGGHGSTINTGIREATGKYFRALDGDDWVNSENLCKLVDSLKHVQSDMVLCDYTTCYSNGSEVTEHFDGLEPGKTHVFSHVTAVVSWMRYHTIIYRTQLLQEHQIHLD